MRSIDESVTWLEITTFDRIEPLSSFVDTISDESTCIRVVGVRVIFLVKISDAERDILV